MAEIKRLNYFNSQFLVDKDFNDEQSYHVTLRRRLSRALHTWGVAEGLDVTQTGPKEVTITPGLAVDRDGREIILPSDPAPAPVSLAAFGANTDVYLTIRYQEVFDPADHYTAGGLDKYTRTTERPLAEVSGSAPVTDGSVIPLAKIRIGANNAIAGVDTTVRTRASSAISPDTDMRTRSLSISGGQWDITNTEGDLKIGNNATRLKVGVALTGGGAGDVRLRAHGGTNRLLIGSGTNDVLSVAGSFVGIGTITPTSTLDVRGNVEIGGGGLIFADATGVAYPDNWIGMANNIDGTTRWLHIGGITDAGARRICLISDRLFASGRLGIGINAPDAQLHITGGQWDITNTEGDLKIGNNVTRLKIGVANAGGGAGDTRIRAQGGTNRLALGSGTTDTLIIVGNSVGVGQWNPQPRVHVGSLTAISEGGGGVAAWANFGSNSYFDGAWKRIDATKPGVNFHLNGDGAGQEFRFYRDTGTNPGNIAVIGSGTTYFTSNVAVGHQSPGFILDVNGRSRFRDGGGSAGLWLFNNGADRAFIGMMDDGRAGFFGNAGAGWSLMINTGDGTVELPPGRKIYSTGRLHIFGEELLYLLNKSGVTIGKEWGGTGNLWVQGTLRVDGGKNAYVMDQFVNAVDETLEQGDVVVIGRNQASLYYGKNDNIPMPEVDLTDQAYDTRVCGIVCEVHGQVVADETAGAETEGAPKASKRRGGKKAAPETPNLRVREFSAEETARTGETRVGPGQTGYMVTLGAFTHCKVDADIAPIEVGDLLTTSPTKGHAQKVTEPGRATGAIVAKALGSLPKGKGKIPVIVTLQ